MAARRPITHEDLLLIEEETMALQAGAMIMLDSARALNARVNTAMIRLKNKRPRNTEVA